MAKLYEGFSISSGKLIVGEIEYPEIGKCCIRDGAISYLVAPETVKEHYAIKDVCLSVEDN